MSIRVRYVLWFSLTWNNLVFSFVLEFIDYHAPKKGKMPNCALLRAKLNHNICTQTSLTEKLTERHDHRPK